MSPEFVTVEEAADRLRIHVETMRRWIRTGKVASIKLGKKYLIPSQLLDELLAAASSGASVSANRKPEGLEKSLSVPLQESTEKL